MTPHEIFELGTFQFCHGGAVPEARIAYATYGELNAGRDNVIVFPTWFSGTHADLEWLIGPGEPLDSNRYFVVVPSMFANGLSSSPSNTPAPFDRARFPKVTILDNVRAQHRLITELFDVQAIELVIGGSMGAMQAFQWGLSHREIVRRVMACCGSSKVSEHCDVFTRGVQAALEADVALEGGDYADPPVTGLRAMARVWAGWGLSQPFYRQRLYQGLGFETVDAFLEGFWEAYFVTLDANNLLSQLWTWRHADISQTPGYDGDWERALGDIAAETFVVPAERDLYFPPDDCAWQVVRMPRSELRVIPGVWGHQSEVGLDPECSLFLGRTVTELLAR